ncbi:hypothetical protein ACOSQ2_005242 [Xanthoceras sorbifolium]|uniref:Myb/SANT-like domain-containing protein n=1 Tax=Xanthoceras sorbifolium TaxID=99658 RepID=A0ABQ8IFI0_9ROSI|nr:hypothetical protein JRO89_XS02G0111700 [Xanthoceras sorbifolium]
MEPYDVDGNAEWSTRIEAIFIRILHEHVKKDDLQTSTLHMKVWNTICNDLFQQTQRQFTIMQLKSKFNRLRKKHGEFSDLIAHTGFSWDPISNIVTASEVVWAEYIKKVPAVKPYQKKGLEHYEILKDIFNSITVTAQPHFFSSQVIVLSDDDSEVDDNFINFEVDVGKETADVDFDSIEILPKKKNGKRPSQSIGPSNDRHKKKWDSYPEAARFTEVTAKSAESTNNSYEQYIVTECVEALES